MKNEVEEMKINAEAARDRYKMGELNRKEAKEIIDLYLNVFNEKSKELAKKWNQKPKLITLAGYLR